ncbi:MAG: DUF6116 family protein [Pirellulales bacterium]
MTQAPGLVATIKQFAAQLRFPYLFLLTAAIFCVDLLVPDVVPLADEIVLGLVTLLLASLKKKLALDVPPPGSERSPGDVLPPAGSPQR